MPGGFARRTATLFPIVTARPEIVDEPFHEH
jgi:hypothetical protein